MRKRKEKKKNGEVIDEVFQCERYREQRMWWQEKMRGRLIKRRNRREEMLVQERNGRMPVSHSNYRLWFKVRVKQCIKNLHNKPLIVSNGTTRGTLVPSSLHYLTLVTSLRRHLTHHLTNNAPSHPHGQACCLTNIPSWLRST